MSLLYVNTDISHLASLSLAPVLFALYVHFIALATLPPPSSMPGTPASMNSSADTSLRHDEYYISGGDLIIRVCGIPIEYRVVD